jgi:hypothetical protein
VIKGEYSIEKRVDQHLTFDLVSINFVQGAVAHDPPEWQTVQEHDLSIVHLKSLWKPVRTGFQASCELNLFIDWLSTGRGRF